VGASEKMPQLFGESRAATDKGFELLGYPVKHLRIPYEHTTMPPYFIKPDASDAPRPLLVIVNGSDGSVIDVARHRPRRLLGAACLGVRASPKLGSNRTLGSLRISRRSSGLSLPMLLHSLSRWRMGRGPEAFVPSA
jgi:hypothetical protein